MIQITKYLNLVKKITGLTLWAFPDGDTGENRGRYYIHEGECKPYKLGTIVDVAQDNHECLYLACLQDNGVTTYEQFSSFKVLKWLLNGEIVRLCGSDDAYSFIGELVLKQLSDG